jgi:hypothetical protein
VIDNCKRAGPFEQFENLMSEETDSLLIALAQRCGGIEAMLESLFSFLKRKTDFYHIQLPGDKIGTLPLVRWLGGQRLIKNRFCGMI